MALSSCGRVEKCEPPSVGLEVAFCRTRDTQTPEVSLDEIAALALVKYGDLRL